MIKQTLLLLIFLFLSGCAITHEYGPYMGKVVEKETGKPIDGAVVFMKFSTGLGTLAGSTTYYADAVETLTDDDGEFLVPPHRINTFRFMHGWEEHPSIIIFKPGYGAYPHHRNTTPHFGYGTIPANKHFTIELPKLGTRKERGRNTGDALFFDRSEVPYEKYKRMFEAVNQEHRLIGSEPLPDPRKFKWSK